MDGSKEDNGLSMRLTIGTVSVLLTVGMQANMLPHSDKPGMPAHCLSEASGTLRSVLWEG